MSVETRYTKKSVRRQFTSYKCNYCHDEFDNEDDINEHIDEQHPPYEEIDLEFKIDSHNDILIYIDLPVIRFNSFQNLENFLESLNSYHNVNKSLSNNCQFPLDVIDFSGNYATSDNIWSSPIDQIKEQINDKIGNHLDVLDCNTLLTVAEFRTKLKETFINIKNDIDGIISNLNIEEIP